MRNQRRFVATLLAPTALTLTVIAGCDGEEETDGAKPTPPATKASTGPAANGAEKLPAAKILELTQKATAAAPAVRIKGTGHEDGQTFSLDVRYAGAKAAMGNLVADGQRIGVTRIGSAVYVNGDAKFLRAVGGANAVKLLTGKYFKAKPGDPDLADLTEFTYLSKTVPELLRPDGPVRKGERTTLAGRQAITLVDDTGGKLYVATEGPPYALRLDTGSSGRIDFLAYGVPVKVSAPPADKVIDTSIQER